MGGFRNDNAYIAIYRIRGRIVREYTLSLMALFMSDIFMGRKVIYTLDRRLWDKKMRKRPSLWNLTLE